MGKLGHFAQIKYNCATNGPAVRTAVFLSGCSLHCPGCFNKELWDYSYGQELNTEVISTIMDSLEPEFIAGLSILGGEPLDEENIESTKELIEALRLRFGDKKTIWLWTGYNLDSIETRCHDILSKIDVLVDGPFVLSEANKKLPHRGSNNQRVLYRGTHF